MLADVENLATARDPEWGTTNYQSFWVLLPDDSPVERNDVLAELAAQGISARRGIMAAHLEPAYAEMGHVPLPSTEALTNRSLILPLYHDLTESDQQRVIAALRSAARLS
jgi:perosamine synthetase